MQSESVNKSTDAPVLVLAPYLFLGSRKAASPSSVRAHGFTHVLTIGSTSPHKNSHTDAVIYHHISLSHYPSPDQMRDASDIANRFIYSAETDGGKVLVHCTAGVSRSPTIVTAYLMERHGMTLKDALGTVIRARPSANPNQVLLQRLKEVEITLHRRSSLDIDILPAKKSQRLALFLPS